MPEEEQAVTVHVAHPTLHFRQQLQGRIDGADGFHVEHLAKYPQETELHCTTRPPDIILLSPDLEGDGPDFFKLLEITRRANQRAYIVLLLSGKDLQPDEMDDFLQPDEMDDFRKRGIHNFLNVHHPDTKDQLQLILAKGAQHKRES